VNGRAHRLGLALLAAALAGTVAAAGGQARRAEAAPCPPLPHDYAYDSAVQAALSSRTDVWGNQLLNTPGGPTYAAARRFLHPLMLVGPPAGKDPHRLTDSGVYYLAFGRPDDNSGARVVDLHVADGSQVVSGRVRGPSLSVDVGGVQPNERYGSCLARLAPAKLAGGYLPILKTSYRDATGVRYRQESFATRIPQTGSLVSFVRVTIDPRHSGHPRARVRFTASLKGLRRAGDQLRRGRRAALVFSRGAHVHGSSVTYSTLAGRTRTVYVAWISKASTTKPFRLDAASYRQARHSVALYWTRRLAAGARFTVPDRVVMNAERNLLIQNVSHAWRYSLGNPYERFSWELIDVAEVMGEYGFTGVERAIVSKSIHRGSFFPNRADGLRLSAAADYYRRSGDAHFVRQIDPWLQGALGRFELQLAHSTTGLLDPERYGMDIPAEIYGLHDQALVLQGLRAMTGVWAKLGRADLAARATRDAAQLESGLRSAVQSSERPMGDGSLFVPVPLLDGSQQPYGSVTDTQLGSYWNLVMPFALASGIFQPGSREATGLLRYLQNHGSRLLGLVRFRAFNESGKPGYRTPGVDDVYGLNAARFLADNEQPDQLILSLYGKLGADMTQGTFVSGEGSTVGPVQGEYYRSMFRPPNSVNNAFFLETLRLMLVHETRDATGTPTGLELGYSTPRRWLVGGRLVSARGVRTSFGPLSYTLRARRGSVTAHLVVPRRLGSGSLKLRLRLPHGERITSVTVGGRAFTRFDAASETIDLTGLRGRVNLVANVTGT
jgi:hypothetical protein